MQTRTLGLFAVLASLHAFATDPTFLRRSTSAIQSGNDGYKPIFGAGDKDARALRGVIRYGELTLRAETSHTAALPNEESIYVVLEGTGELSTQAEKLPLKPLDYFYIPPSTSHTIAASSPLRVLVMGFRATAVTSAGKIPIANIDDVPMQTVGGHPPSTQYRLLLGTTESKRDRLACSQNVASLFVMEFAPAATNIPHHHETEEEIYYLMEGEGQMVAGGGIDGLEGKFPSVPGDAWFFRLNTTVGFYAGPKSRILAVRSSFPFARR